jgi:hypothetical protein
MMSSSNGCLPIVCGVPQGQERERHPVPGKTPVVGSRWFWVAARRTVISASGVRRCDTVTMLRKPDMKDAALPRALARGAGAAEVARGPVLGS